MSTPDISIVVPVYNEQDNVVALWDEIRTALDGANRAFEAIFVDDGSSDDSVSRLEACAAKDDRLKLVVLARNYGQTAAMQAGIDLARGDVIVPMDGDRQNDPADVVKLVDELDKGYDVVSGWRKDRQDGFLLRRFPSMLANRLIGKKTGVELHDYGCSMKAYKARFLKPVRLYGEMHRFIPAYCKSEGARVGELAVNHRARTAGVSKYGISRTFRVVLDLLVVLFLHKYRGKPIHLFGKFSGLTLLLGVVAGGVGLIASLMSGNWVYGMTGLASGLVLVGVAGVWLAAGLIAELLWRTWYETQQRTSYTIGRSVNLVEG